MISDAVSTELAYVLSNYRVAEALRNKLSFFQKAFPNRQHRYSYFCGNPKPFESLYVRVDAESTSIVVVDDSSGEETLLLMETLEGFSGKYGSYIEYMLSNVLYRP